jgi:hypothetical protein
MDSLKEFVSQYIKDNGLMAKRCVRVDNLLAHLLSPNLYVTAGKCLKDIVLKAIANNVKYTFTVT